MMVFLFVAVLALVGAMGWQHARYLAARRGPVQDQQSLLYSANTFHVLTFLLAEEGQDVIEGLRKLRGELESGGQAKMVYAGRVALVGLASKQLPEIDWDAVVLVQYPSRETYDAIATDPAYRASLGTFSKTFSQGVDRPVALNLAIPQFLLAVRLYEWVTRVPSHFPFIPAADDTQHDPRLPSREDRMARLDALRPLGEDAVVVVNLLRGGTAAERAADRSYGLKMAGLFAEGGNGPMHMGRAITIEGDAKFDNVALVYYPGIDFMQEMLGSTFYGGIVGDKQPGDTLAAPTVPVLSRL